MNCRRIQELLYLDRAGELSEAEARMVADHVRVCEFCSREQAAMERTRKFLQDLAVLPTAPSDPEDLTQRILERVSGARPTPHRDARASVLDWLLSVFAGPAPRWASACVIICTIGLFLSQYFTVLSEMSALEAHQDRQDRTLPLPRLAYVVDARPLRHSVDATLFARFDGIAPDGIVTVDAESAQTWQATERTSTLGIARRPVTDDEHRAAKSLITYVKLNARPVLTFSREGV